MSKIVILVGSMRKGDIFGHLALNEAYQLGLTVE